MLYFDVFNTAPLLYFSQIATTVGRLPEELARRDMVEENRDQDDLVELKNRMNDYMDEFEKNGVDRLTVDQP